VSSGGTAHRKRSKERLFFIKKWERGEETRKKSFQSKVLKASKKKGKAPGGDTLRNGCDKRHLLQKKKGEMKKKKRRGTKKKKKGRGEVNTLPFDPPGPPDKGKRNSPQTVQNSNKEKVVVSKAKNPKKGLEITGVQRKTM